MSQPTQEESRLRIQAMVLFLICGPLKMHGILNVQHGLIIPVGSVVLYSQESFHASRESSDSQSGNVQPPLNSKSWKVKDHTQASILETEGKFLK